MINGGTFDKINELSGAFKPVKEVFCKDKMQWLGDVQGVETFPTAPWVAK